MSEYIKRLDKAESLAEMDSIVEEVAFDESISDTEYERIYAYALKKVRGY